MGGGAGCLRSDESWGTRALERVGEPSNKVAKVLERASSCDLTSARDGSVAVDMAHNVARKSGEVGALLSPTGLYLISH